MREDVIKTLLHTLELAVIMAAVFGATKWLGLPLSPELTTIVVAAIVKFARTSEKTPIKDYVNNR